MAKQLIKVDNLTAAITDVLTEYNKDVDDKVYKAGHRAIKDLENKTIDTAPINRRRKRGDHFRESIASKSERERIGLSTHTWYVKSPNYRLTHLIVKGHKTPRGNMTRANPFLEAALRVVLKKYEKDVDKAVRNG